MVHIRDKIRILNPTVILDTVDLVLVFHGIFVVVAGMGLQLADVGLGRAILKLLDPAFDADLFVWLRSICQG